MNTSATPVAPRPRATAPVPARLGPDAALALARSWFLEQRRIDLQGLAAELGINRVTLYRWLGAHEQLMGEVLCFYADLAWKDALKNVACTGPEYTARVLHRFLRLLQGFAPFQHFIRDDPEYALKLLTSKHSRVQAQVVQRIRVLLEGEVQAQRLELPTDLESLAYALVRICEAFLYNDLITGRAPDLDKAKEIIGALLQAPWRTLRL
ncbi:TetR/AcrR family transcriptional regulator [Stagnimonas aquatica]|uniref:TetR/AcrR family transcriptional regulator n=1 Tax=Stagnimonas aquatica TaxID=2689987 RepID=A0A3N0V139_9GAMM|nr:QsdR family transcriptional regulator [Stagnimonas aquatica]ROH86526.1 TetR/AcrR family transcriptional regulator [Stagnimonas aquatica]